MCSKAYVSDIQQLSLWSLISLIELLNEYDIKNNKLLNEINEIGIASRNKLIKLQYQYQTQNYKGPVAALLVHILRCGNYK